MDTHFGNRDKKDLISHGVDNLSGQRWKKQLLRLSKFCLQKNGTEHSKIFVSQSTYLLVSLPTPRRDGMDRADALLGNKAGWHIPRTGFYHRW